MTEGLDGVRDLVVRHLSAYDLVAVTAWGGADRVERDGAVVSVSLRGCSVDSGGFRDYLGERYNSETQDWEEVYGRRATLTLGLDLYARQAVGEGAIDAAFSTLTQAMVVDGIASLGAVTLTCGETEYLEGERLLKRSVEAVCNIYLYIIAEAGGTFQRIEVKGGLIE